MAGVKGVGSIPLQEDGNADEVSYNAALWQQSGLCPSPAGSFMCLGPCGPTRQGRPLVGLISCMETIGEDATEATINSLRSRVALLVDDGRWTDQKTLQLPGIVEDLCIFCQS